MNRKIFIDCGFYAGAAINSFKSTPEYSSDFIYYGFDPMLKIEIAQKRWPNVTLFNKAIWVNDGNIDFYISGRIGGKANGIYHNNRAGKREINLKVPCMDFSKWLSSNFDESDYIVLKMDVEGAEYELIPKMIQDSTIGLIDVIYLEWHCRRAKDSKYIKYKEIMTELKKKEGLVIRQSIEWYLAGLKRKQAKEQQEKK